MYRSMPPAETPQLATMCGTSVRGPQKAAKAQKEADNSEAAAKLVQLEGAVGNQEKTVGSTQFDGTRSSF